MVDFDYYVNSYLGTVIPEDTFPAAAARAEETLDRFCRCYRVTGGEESKKMAVCAMAEAVHTAARSRGGLTAASAGSVSVRYESGRSGEKELWQELYRQASVYLDIYRGVRE